MQLFRLFLLGLFLSTITLGRSQEPCESCKKKDDLDKLQTSVNNVAQKFNNEEMDSIRSNLLHWKCHIPGRALYLVDKTEKIEAKNFVGNYQQATDCLEDEYNLNNNSSVVINSTDGKKYFNKIMVCRNNAFFLVDPRADLTELNAKTEIHGKYFVAREDCIKFPREYNSLSNAKKIKLIFDQKRVDSYQQDLLKHQEKFYKDHFN